VPIDELVVGLLAFFIVFGVLAKVALPKIKETLAARSEAIEGGLRKAEEAQAEAQRALEEYRAALASAREAASIRTQAQADRAAIVEEARAEARAAAAAVTAQAEAQLAAERAQATSQLTRQVGEVAVALAGKVVGQSLTDDARVKSTVDSFLADLESQVAQQGAGR
jgi:F-type H+-transporting ATPase subunit b